MSSKGLSSGFQFANDYCIFLSEWEYLLQFTIIYCNGRSEAVITCLFKSLIIRQSGATFKLDVKDCTLPGNPGLFDRTVLNGTLSCLLWEGAKWVCF